MKNFFYITVCIVLLVSCKNKNTDTPTDTPTSGVIAIASDGCFAPVVEEEIAVFESIYKEAGIVPYFSGETETINSLLHDSTRLAITSRPLTKEETEFMNSKKLFPKSMQIATDAIALIVNKENTDSLIGIPVLKDILTGKMKEWKDVNRDNKSGMIEVVFDNPNSGTVHYAIDSICAGEAFAGNLHAMKDNRQVIEYVTRNRGALGIIGANWISNPSDSTNMSFLENIRVMAVSPYRNATVTNSFKPYQAYIALKSYPMTRPVFLILSEPRMGLASGFTTFISSDRGQRIILKSGIIPATQPVRLVNVRDQL
ncbi:phosphate ABC transporter substrate-binding protein [Parabacteroides sp. TM07-1AC]|uniref:PstS family phosphate ABC transporter substrate-binding protein n=1 Tax=Parabacteroides sp. TM07-1AC TaxID=2292363 RepID=UPI000F00B848|nr:substrate-binding domain-containing protein [Parabacteroides sp. TM07-1AC]RHU21875.1 phosphate ABC transporter substrate-binding protein [Parabacteroides sp. TM07-1AC]